MGNLYSAPERTGKSPYTRTGEPPPKLLNPTGSDAPNHKVHNQMSLELHMADERVRAAGLSPAEREWRRKWLTDQALHPDEPISVDAVNRTLNPIRVLYRWPWDKLYIHFLRPTFGVYYGHCIRVAVPKIIIGFLLVQALYYEWKYNPKNWQHHKGVEHSPEKQNQVLLRGKWIEEKYPGLKEKAFPDQAQYDYVNPTFAKRTAFLDVGETSRPW
ncbi:hypothetical protein WR25_23991 [Diploscapter pachys]|uniref:Uncharacterized protein n=1 Tax=Diploscapter pachys TaxID=2018661 RepID=A0A2A2L0E7_9BILA|nr:hypothetical protein WR25_23991 [Diploscapter pachys]